MANLLFGTPLYSDAEHGATWSGGSWQAALPVTNVALRKLQKLARSTNAAVASTLATVDLGQVRDVRLLAALLPNVSTAGTVRVRGLTSVPFLDSLDFSTGWSAVQTPTRSAAAHVCDDGVPLDLIGDNNGTDSEYYQRDLTGITATGAKTFYVRIKAGTSPAAAGGRFQVRDTTAAADRLLADWTFTAGVINLTVTTGTLVSSTLTNGVYRLVINTTSLTHTNTNSVRVFPAISPTQQGDVYVGDVMMTNDVQDRLAYDTGFVLAIPSAVGTEEREAVNCWWVHPTAAAQSARYWRFNLADAANADGYLDVARLLVAGGYQPEVNASYGAGVGFESKASSEETEGGAAVYDARRVRRTMFGLLEQQSEDEAFGQWFRIQMAHGLTKQLFAVWDPDDTTHLHRRAFAGVLQELTAIEAPYFARYASAFKVIEDL